MRCFSLIVLLLVTLVSVAQELTITRSREHLQCRHRGIRRCVRYDVASNEIDPHLDGLRIAFITDIHYASRFTAKSLESLGAMLRELNADVILMGGDYQEGCEYVEPLFSTVMTANPKYAFGVLGNNDYERCTDVIRNSMQANGITLLENNYQTVDVNGAMFAVAGAKNTFAARESVPCPTVDKPDSLFTILVTHTPDYVDDVDCSNVDLALAGHVHGGQVTLFGLYAPVLPSHYGQKFRTGLRKSNQGLPVIISNGIGTSRKAIRFCAPAEIQLIVLHSK